MTTRFDLRLGECVPGLALVEANAADVAFLDPPYSDHVHKKSVRGSAAGGLGADRSRDLGFEPLTAELRLAVALELARIVRRWIGVFSDLESCHLWRADLVAAGLEYVRSALWIKLGGTPQTTGDRPAQAFEVITLAHRPGRKWWNGGGKHGLYETRAEDDDLVYRVPIVGHNRRDEPRVHTTQKPVRLMEALVRDFTAPGELILDPFAGSGTTGVAALRYGRRFLGWERDPVYHAGACTRLAETGECTELIAITAPRPPKRKPHDLFAPASTSPLPAEPRPPTKEDDDEV